MSCVAVQTPVPLPKQSTNLHFHAFRSFCDAITILAVCQNPLETRSESTLEILSRAQPRAAELRNTIGFTHHSFFFFFSASQLYGYCAFTSDNGFRTSFSHWKQANMSREQQFSVCGQTTNLWVCSCANAQERTQVEQASSDSTCDWQVYLSLMSHRDI